MSLWHRLWRRSYGQPLEPEPTDANRDRLVQLLYRLADDIAAARDDDDSISLRWSRSVRDCADLIRAGNPRGLNDFLGGFLFDNDPRNTARDQPFVQTRRFEEARRLANALLKEHDRTTPRYAGEPDVLLRPWSEGHTGKAVLFKDGTVVATEDGLHGDPHIAELKASQPDKEPVAAMAIRPNGSCAVYHNERDRDWLAARLHEHHPALHLERRPPRA